MKSNRLLPFFVLAVVLFTTGCDSSSVRDLPLMSQFLQPTTTPTSLPTATWTPTTTDIPTSTFTATPLPTPTSTGTPFPTATLASVNPPTTGLEIEHGDPQRPWIALTFDAGSSIAPLPSMLDTLRQKDVRCTFFLAGIALRQPGAQDLLQQMVADGHELANHSDTHHDFRELTDEQIAQELAALEKMVVEITGISTKPYFRPPYGARDDRVWRVVQENGYVSIYWTYPVWDWVEDKTTETVFNYAIGGACNGAIVVMHVQAQETADALPAIIDELRARGYRLVTLSELLAP